MYIEDTNFSMETIELDTNDIDISDTENSRIQCEIAQRRSWSHKFLTSKRLIYFQEPTIMFPTNSDGLKIRTNVINEARLLIGSTEIDKHDSNFFNIYSRVKE